MTTKAYKAAKTQANKLVKKIDSFIDLIETEQTYNGIGLIMKRLIRKANEDDLRDISWELEIEANIRTFKIESLVQEFKLESFLQDITENPYQLKLIA